MADDEQFSLCWNNFNSNLSAGFHESLCRGDLVDVTLAAEGQFVKAHRLVLSVCSPYFRKMFTQMPANQHAFVFLKDVSHSALKDLIQFMYCGEVNVKQEALPAFISTAEALQIKGLTDGDPAPSQSPAKPSTPAPQPVQPAQTITTQTLSSPRVRQRSSTSRTYRIETDDSDDKSPQIVLQTTTVSQQTQPTIVQSSTTTTVNASQKRVAPRSITAPQSKRVKNVTDPLEAAEPTQISVQTVSENKATNETEFIDLPIEIPTKSEPDYAEEAGEVETAEQDATYVEDDTYADMKYDESYFTENEEGGTTSGGAGTATTSTAVVKQSFVDNSYVEQSEQSAGEAQGDEQDTYGKPSDEPVDERSGVIPRPYDNGNGSDDESGNESNSKFDVESTSPLSDRLDGKPVTDSDNASDMEVNEPSDDELDQVVPLHADSDVYVTKRDIFRIFTTNSSVYTGLLSEIVFGKPALLKCAELELNEKLSGLNSSYLNALIAHVLFVFRSAGEKIDEEMVKDFVLNKIIDLSENK